MSGTVQECATQSAFDAALQQAGASQLVVVDFTASWCGPCKMIKPHFEALAKQYTGVKFLKVDVDANSATARAYGVSAMPTFIFLKNKSVLETVRGADKNKLTAAVEKHSVGSTASAAAFSGQGNTLGGSGSGSGGANPSTRPSFRRRPNPFGDDEGEEEEEEEEEEGLVDENADDADDDADSALRSYLDSQQSQQPQDEGEIRYREERIRAGGMRNVKSRYQREKDEALRKKREQEEEAKRAYDEFVKHMGGGGGAEDDGEGGGGSSRRPSGPGAAGTHRPRAMGFVAAGSGTAYEAKRPQSTTAVAAAKPPSSATAPLGGVFGDEDDDDGDDNAGDDAGDRGPKAAALAPPPPPSAQPPKRKRAMDDFLGELQKEQAQREVRYKDKIAEGKSVSSILALEGQKMGSRTTPGDNATTNVCMLNLPANVSEKTLGEFAAQWGDVGTVKIMWPRGGEEAAGGAGAGAGLTALRNTRSAGLTGFVCYMRRDDAEHAMRAGDGIVWGGCTLRTSWGKAMPKPARAFYVMPHSSRREKDQRERERPRTNDHLPSRGRRRSESPTTSPSSSSTLRPRREKNHRHRTRCPSPRSQITASLGAEQTRLIQTVAARIRQYGPSFEDMVKDKERDNPQFAFLRGGGEDAVETAAAAAAASTTAPGTTTADAEFFRMCMDERYEPVGRAADFQDEGYHSLYSSDSGEDSETDRLRKHRRTETLGRFSRHRFESMLRGLTLRRERIARCTAFAIEHAHASDVVADVLTQSLLLPSTPIPRKLARLYVISDVLHNSAVPLPHAWKYRSAFESHGRLQVVFKHFAAVARSFPGIMKQEGVRGQLRALLDVWDDWMVFSPSVMRDLHEIVDARNEGGVVSDDIDGEAIEAIEAMDGEAIDGEAIDGEDL